MNWAAVAAIGSLLGLVVTIIGVAYTSGQITQQVRDNANKTQEHTGTLKEHAEKLEDHNEKIGRLQEWKNGFNAAARVSGNKEVV